MRENLLDALMFVFENFIEENPDELRDEKHITKEMLGAGFHRQAISKALSWFGDLNELRNIVKDQQLLAPESLRIYTEYESARLSIEARGYLLFLEKIGIIDPISRELVIDRVMALDDALIEPTEIKWVTLMVLFSQQDKKEQLKLMEDLVLIHEDSIPH